MGTLIFIVLSLIIGFVFQIFDYKKPEKEDVFYEGRITISESWIGGVSIDQHLEDYSVENIE